MRYVVFALFVLLTTIVAALAQAPCCAGNNFAVSYTGLVATSNIQAWSDSANKQNMSRSAHFAKQALSSFQLIMPNFSVGASAQNAGNGNSGTINASTITASIEFPAGTCTQVLFSGGATGTMATGVYSLSSDVVTMVPPIPNGALFWVRAYYVGAAGNLGGNQFVNQISGEVANISNASADQTISCGNIPNNAGGGNSGIYAPMAIVGTTNAPSVCILGDSIALGHAFITTRPGVITPEVNPVFASVNLSIGGTTIHQGWVATVGAGAQPILYPFCTHLIDELGTNDAQAGFTTSQMETDLQTIYSTFTGVAKSPAAILRTTIMPRTNSSDNWATSINQTPISVGFENIREAFNSDVKAQTFFSGFVEDYLPSVATGPSYKFWLSQATSPACSTWRFTIEGTHPTPCGIQQLVASGLLNTNNIHR